MNTSTLSSSASAQRIGGRCQPFYQRDGQWFVSSDDNGDAGPFSNKAEAQLALVYFTQEDHWPSEKELRSYQR
ncbi:hypothetical protein GYB62_01450 [bacterium]|nr:hypothetical protein [bacterium]